MEIEGCNILTITHSGGQSWIVELDIGGFEDCCEELRIQIGSVIVYMSEIFDEGKAWAM